MACDSLQDQENVPPSTSSAAVDALPCSALGLSLKKPICKRRSGRKRVPLEDITHLFLNLSSPPIPSSFGSISAGASVRSSTLLASSRQASHGGSPRRRRASDISGAASRASILRKGFR
ncbi:hypothetical protein OPV22_016500 [Ensete ventricosum]|uniref:Uncharacterized protein n=1 Tax=Ensete ventricosum TaxID=4639 RepID=A0AAV8PEB9_ENSVE|nr:hypothetical protein OPV22_016500 [Ensete ventricosum]RWW10353.1 hypothetical protein GW17_00026105 [Ensete ventricosum]RWW66357.1 hypothetical protein BHE74_00026309 [Ensete ventricosum]RZR83346.1 hypothetical protein BHM03_00009950 [Ensete ventricosum]